MPTFGVAGESRGDVLIGNNWDGTADVVDPRHVRAPRPVNIVPDQRRARWPRSGRPRPRGVTSSPSQQIGEGHDQYVDDAFTSHDGPLPLRVAAELRRRRGLDLTTEEIVWRTPVEGYRADHMAISPTARACWSPRRPRQGPQHRHRQRADRRQLPVGRLAAREQLLQGRHADLPREHRQVYTPPDDPALDAARATASSRSSTPRRWRSRPST